MKQYLCTDEYIGLIHPPDLAVETGVQAADPSPIVPLRSWAQVSTSRQQLTVSER
jgi:hypothetical protein